MNLPVSPQEPMGHGCHIGILGVEPVVTPEFEGTRVTFVYQFTPDRHRYYTGLLEKEAARVFSGARVMYPAHQKDYFGTAYLIFTQIVNGKLTFSRRLLHATKKRVQEIVAEAAQQAEDHPMNG